MKQICHHKKSFWYFIALSCAAILLLIYFSLNFHGQKELAISFSHMYARELGLDYKQTYLDILDEMPIKQIKLSTYFNEIWPNPDTFDFELLDWQLDEARKRNVQVILAIGLRTPRWPECHAPLWFAQLDQKQREEHLLQYIQTLIERYKQDDTITMWQIENEPMLGFFGACLPFVKSTFIREIQLARSLDDRPIMSTMSGELEWWPRIQSYVDIVGISMYRVVYNKYIGYIDYTYFFSPSYYEIKRFFMNKPVQVTEYQLEPWAPKPLTQIDENEERLSMTHAHFEHLFEYIHQHSFETFFLWGAEWWYYKKVMHDDPYYWDYAKGQINKVNSTYGRER